MECSMLHIVDICNPLKSVYHLSLKMPSECNAGEKRSEMVQEMNGTRCLLEWYLGPANKTMLYLLGL